MAERDFYQTLGISRNATAEEIQRAFRKLARRYHPDVNKDPSAEDRFKEVNEAYHVLSDPETRAKYDQFGEDFRHVPDDFAAAGASAGAGAGPSGSAWSRRAGTAQGGRARGGARQRGYTGGINIEDLFNGVGGFEDLFNDGPLAGSDQEAVIELTVEEAYRGGKRRVTLGGGSGERTYEVTIPPGVTDGQRIRLTGQGGQGSQGGARGDLYLIVRIKPDRRFRVNARDIETDLPIAPWEAALGATVPVQGPGGDLKVTVPPGTSSGVRLRLAGEGMPNRRGRAGDLYAVVSIKVPRRLTKRERDLFEQLASSSSFDPRKGTR